MALLDRWKVLLNAEIAAAESKLLAKLAHVNCNPPPLFHKRATKFDSLLASGVSTELHAVTQIFFDTLRDLKQRVAKYVHIGYEPNANILYSHLADAVLDTIKRLDCKRQCELKSTAKYFRITVTHVVAASSSSAVVAKHSLLPSEENQRWLKEFRLYLAFVQYEPSIINQCMFDDTEKAVQCNQLLRGAAENALK